MIPSLRDGLHCGIAGMDAANVGMIVIPSLRDGLHCGSGGFGAAGQVRIVIPSLRNGLHCGPFAGRVISCYGV